MNSIKDVKAKLLANPAVRQDYDAQAPEFELARELIAARTQAGLTQGDVAARMGTTTHGASCCRSYSPLGTFDFTRTLGLLGAAGLGASSKPGEGAAVR